MQVLESALCWNGASCFPQEDLLEGEVDDFPKPWGLSRRAMRLTFGFLSLGMPRAS